MRVQPLLGAGAGDDARAVAGRPRRPAGRGPGSGVPRWRACRAPSAILPSATPAAGLMRPLSSFADGPCNGGTAMTIPLQQSNPDPTGALRLKHWVSGLRRIDGDNLPMTKARPYRLRHPGLQPAEGIGLILAQGIGN